MNQIKHKTGLLWRKFVTSFRRPKIGDISDKGRLSPNQFVEAGDNLVTKCPTWEWMYGESKDNREYLPENKQYLISKRIPCYPHSRQKKENATCLDADDIMDGEWLMAGINEFEKEWKTGTDNAVEEIIIPPASESYSLSTSKDNTQSITSEDNDTFQLITHLNKRLRKNKNDLRFYDMSIVYDMFYQTPHVYICGYNSDGLYLSSDEMLEDISSDYIMKTVTIDPHPFHLYKQCCLSIHPCMHATTMNHLISIIEDNNKEMPKSMYLFLYIKFVMSVIPSFNYDFTTEICLI